MPFKRTLTNKALGRKGGLKTAEKYGSELAQSRGEKGGNASLRQYGRDYYVGIRKLRKLYPKKYKTRKKALRD